MRKLLVTFLIVLGIGLVTSPITFRLLKEWQAESLIKSYKKQQQAKMADTKEQSGSKQHDQVDPEQNNLNQTSSSRGVASKKIAADESSQLANNQKSAVTDVADTKDQVINQRKSTENLTKIFNKSFSLTANPFRANRNLDGYLKIRSINVELPLYRTATNANLATGVGIVAGTDEPGSGQNTNSVIAGHRGYGGTPMFMNLPNVPIGASVEVNYGGQVLNYRVYQKRIINPNNLAALAPIRNREVVTLLTCHPWYSNRQRYLVFAERI